LVLRQRAHAVRAALPSMKWLAFQWLCPGPFLQLYRRRSVLRFRWVRPCRLVLR
jgi:hypothetical protein